MARSEAIRMSQAMRRLQAAGQRPAVDRADDRLVDPVHAAGEAVQPELGDLAQSAGARLLDDRRDVGLQVGAGAERLAGAGEDRDVDRVVVAEVGPGLDHQPVDVGVDRVAGLGPVDRQVSDPVALFVEQLRHRRLLLGCGAGRIVRAAYRCQPTGECRHRQRRPRKSPPRAGSFVRTRRGSPPGRRPPRRSRRPHHSARSTAREGRSTPASSGATWRSAITTSPITIARDCSRTRRKRSRFCSSVRWWTESTEITRSHGPVGQRVLHSRQAHLDPQLARLEHHLRLRVEPGQLRVRVARQEPSRRLAGAHPELQHPAGRERDRLDRLLLELVVARHLGPDLVQIGVGIEVELRAHAEALRSALDR